MEGLELLKILWDLKVLLIRWGCSMAVYDITEQSLSANKELPTNGELIDSVMGSITPSGKICSRDLEVSYSL